jgi:hypothetical protein
VLRTVRNVASVLVTLTIIAAHASAGEWDINERQLRKLENDLLTAYVMLDFTTLNELYADDFFYISNDGALMNKRSVVEMVKTAMFRVDSIPVSNSRIRLYGNTAIVSGIRKFYRAGKKLAETRYAEVWVNRNRRWQCVSSQLTPILEK